MLLCILNKSAIKLIIEIIIYSPLALSPVHFLPPPAHLIHIIPSGDGGEIEAPPQMTAEQLQARRARRQQQQLERQQQQASYGCIVQ